MIMVSSFISPLLHSILFCQTHWDCPTFYICRPIIFDYGICQRAPLRPIPIPI